MSVLTYPCEGEEVTHNPLEGDAFDTGSMNYSIGILFLFILTIVGFLFRSRYLDRPLSGRYRFGLALLQAIPLLLLAWLLIDPRFHGGYKETLTKVIALVVDDSPSMSLSDDESGGTRLEAAEKWVEDIQRDWQKEPHQAQISAFRTSQLVPAGVSASDYAAVIEGLLQKIQPDRLASVILIGDGQHHGPQSPVLAADSLGVPMNTVGIGAAQKSEFIQARWIEAPGEVAPGTPFLSRWQVESDTTEPVAAEVHITFASDEVLSRDISLEPAHSMQEDWIGLRSVKSGMHLLRLVVNSKRTGELITQATASIHVEASTPSILILESEPSRLAQSFSQAVLHNGRYRILRPVSLGDGSGILWDLFRSDAESEAKAPWSHEKMVRLDPSHWEALLEETLPNINMLVLGKNPLGRMPAKWLEVLEKHFQSNRTGLLALPGAESLAPRVQKGGLKEVLVLMEQRSPSLRALDLSFPEDSRNHPSLAPIWSLISRPLQIGPDKFFDQRPPYSTLLVSDPSEKPLVLETRMGLSHAILVAPENLWTLAAFGGGSEGTGTSLLEGLWLGVADYLAGYSIPRKIKVEAHPNPGVVGQQIKVIVQDPSITPGPPLSGLEVKATDGQWQVLPLSPDPDWAGLGSTSWYARQAGDYTMRYARQDSHSIQFKVLDQSPESSDRLLNESLLRDLAESTGGQYAMFADRARIMSDIDFPPLTVQRSGSFPLRHDLRFGAGLAILFCLGWGIRRLLSLP